MTGRALSSSALLVLALMSLALAFVLVAQYQFGMMPCELCLDERWPYYLGIPLALFIAIISSPRRGEVRWGASSMRNLDAPTLTLPLRGREQLVALLMTITLLLILGWSFYLGAYHTGIEWHLWNGPASCEVGNGLSSVFSGGAPQAIPTEALDLLAQLKDSRVMPCDQPQWRLLGLLSFANMNALLSLMLFVVAAATLAGNDPIENALKKLKAYASSSVSQ